MPFQSTVRIDQTTGVVGDIVLDGATDGRPAILNSTSAANNVIGRAFRAVAGEDQEVTADGTGSFAGILANSKRYATSGTTAGGTLAPTLALPNNSEVELVSFTAGILVELSTVAAIGNNVFYANASGILAAAAGTTLANHTMISGASIVRNNITGSGRLAVVQIR